jgi:Mce-associated membrane protein
MIPRLKIRRRGHTASEQADSPKGVDDTRSLHSKAVAGTEDINDHHAGDADGLALAPSGDDGEGCEASAEVDHAGSSASCTRVDIWKRRFVFGVVPALTFLLAIAAACLKYTESSVRASQSAAAESVGIAAETTIKMLSYQPATVDADLGSVRDRLTGRFRDSYTTFTHDVVIPASKQRSISAMAKVTAAAADSADGSRTVVVLFVDQTMKVGEDPPTNTSSVVRETLQKISGRWLVSDFTPV